MTNASKKRRYDISSTWHFVNVHLNVDLSAKEIGILVDGG
jgi:hypothetical protein